MKILYVKMKESGPVGGGMHWACPPKSANVAITIIGIFRRTRLVILFIAPMDKHKQIFQLK